MRVKSLAYFRFYYLRKTQCLKQNVSIDGEYLVSKPILLSKRIVGGATRMFGSYLANTIKCHIYDRKHILCWVSEVNSITSHASHVVIAWTNSILCATLRDAVHKEKMPIKMLYDQIAAFSWCLVLVFDACLRI